MGAMAVFPRGKLFAACFYADGRVISESTVEKSCQKRMDMGGGHVGGQLSLVVHAVNLPNALQLMQEPGELSKKQRGAIEWIG